MANSNALLLTIQEILFREWDPIGVNNNELCRDEYDSYASSLLHLLHSGADEFKIAARLSQFQRESMGMSVIDEKLHQQIAKRLVKLMT